jgi:hypothetical protein
VDSVGESTKFSGGFSGVAFGDETKVGAGGGMCGLSLLFHLGAELVGGAAEVGHELAELAREDGQLLWAEEEESE